MKQLNIASIQPHFPSSKKPEVNDLIIENGFKHLIQALEMGAQFCCLPEFFNVFGLANEDCQAGCANAENIIQRTQDLAKKYGAYIVLPLYIKENECYFNRALFISPDGLTQGQYDKIHPTLGEQNNLNITPGTDLCIFKTPLATVAIIICYDIYFPELSVLLSEEQVDIVFFPSLQRSEHEMASEALIKVRAMDTQAYIVRSCYGAPIDSSWKPPMMFGQSAIVHPDGTILANAGHYEGFALAAQIQVPFLWKRARCGGMAEMPVREFINEDRKMTVITI